MQRIGKHAVEYVRNLLTSGRTTKQRRSNGMVEVELVSKKMSIGTDGEAVLESNIGYVVCNIRLAVTRQQIAFESVKLMPTTYLAYSHESSA